MKQPCEECGRKRRLCLPVRRDVDGTIVYVCPECWKRFDYDAFMYEHRT